jgi:hypothetical protein
MILFHGLIPYTFWRGERLFDTAQASVAVQFPSPTPEKSYRKVAFCYPPPRVTRADSKSWWPLAHHAERALQC